MCRTIELKSKESAVIFTEKLKTYISEPAKSVPVVCEADVCVVGGSATGVFAAVRAARLGAKVVLIEKQNCFGGVAASGLVSVWHTYMDTSGQKQIIAGLSEEITDRLARAGSESGGNAGSHFFNPHELKVELDRLLGESGVEFFLHTYYAGLLAEDGAVRAIFIENKDGRGAIKAKFFIDATGDGDLARDLGVEAYVNPNIQPPSACFLMQGDASHTDVSRIIREHGDEVGLESDWGWWCQIPGSQNVTMRADTHVFGLRCDRAADLTKAEVEGRRKMRCVIELLRRYGKPGEQYSVVSACSCIGVRDTVHYRTKYQANELELLTGERYPDAILNGTYGVDVHHADRGITFRYFDGSYQTENPDGSVVRGSWRKERGISDDAPIPTYYQLPFRCLVGEGWTNFIAAGRMINADTGSFGALRVMVNLNQIGEAAGVAAYLSLDQSKSLQSLDGREVAKVMSDGGSANLG